MDVNILFVNYRIIFKAKPINVHYTNRTLMPIIRIEH